MTVIRDDNKDRALGFGLTKFDTGIFGINIHRSNPNTESTQVNKWSAGCQVFAVKKEWDEFIHLCQEKFAVHNQRFTYTLLNVEDVLQTVE